MIHARYTLAIAIIALISFQWGFDMGRDSANGVCKIVCYEDGKAR